LLTARHSLRSPDDIDTSSLGSAQETSFSFDKALMRVFPLTSIIQIMRTNAGIIALDTTRKIDTANIGISIRSLEVALNARDKIEVAVERRFCG
jgi:3D (Asp-Asp-Asp) domain-containing protein